MLNFKVLIFPLFAALFLLLSPAMVNAQDPIRIPPTAGSYGASITTGLAPLQYWQNLSQRFFAEYIAIPSAHAQTADIVTGLIGHGKFDEGSGITAVDSSGNNNTGTLTPLAGGKGKIRDKISS